MDDLRLYTYIAVFGSFGLYFAIAWWARAGSTDEFYAAGGHVGPVANGMAIGADWMSAASFISMAGLIAFLGYGGSVFLMGWTGGYVLLAMMLAPYMRKHGKFTVPEFISDRYDSSTARIVTVVCLIIASLTYIIGQMKGVGVAFSRFFGSGLRFGPGYRHGCGLGLCCTRWHERYHLHPNRPVLRINIRIYRPSYFYLVAIDR